MPINSSFLIHNSSLLMIAVGVKEFVLSDLTVFVINAIN